MRLMGVIGDAREDVTQIAFRIVRLLEIIKLPAHVGHARSLFHSPVLVQAGYLRRARVGKTS